jgi:hypothetical protein
VDSANDFVLKPRTLASVGNAQLTTALRLFKAASDFQKTVWLTAYTKAFGDEAAARNRLTGRWLSTCRRRVRDSPLLGCTSKVAINSVGRRAGDRIPPAWVR